jgi:hypothetical protein
MGPAGSRQKPAHHSFVWIASAWLKFVLLDCLPRKVSGLLWRLPFVLQQRHPLANDLPARFVIYHLGTRGRLRPPWTARRDRAIRVKPNEDSQVLYRLATLSRWHGGMRNLTIGHESLRCSDTTFGYCGAVTLRPRSSQTRSRQSVRAASTMFSTLARSTALSREG